MKKNNLTFKTTDKPKGKLQIIIKTHRRHKKPLEQILNKYNENPEETAEYLEMMQ